MELSEHVVDFEKCSAIKTQILANFVVEWTEPGSATEGAVLESPWLVHCDGAWGAAGAEAAAILPHLWESGCATRQDYNSAKKWASAPITLQSMRLSYWGSTN
jgi:hypothetical protein